MPHNIVTQYFLVSLQTRFCNLTSYHIPSSVTAHCPDYCYVIVQEDSRVTGTCDHKPRQGSVMFAVSQCPVEDIPNNISKAFNPTTLD